MLWRAKLGLRPNRPDAQQPTVATARRGAIPPAPCLCARDQPLTAGGAADPQAATAPNAKAEKPPEPRQVPERAKVAEPD